MSKKVQKSKGGNRKHGRNKVFCNGYRLSNRREKNKAKGIKKHLTRFPDDKTASAALDRLAQITRI